jgi:hypothetical protein
VTTLLNKIPFFSVYTATNTICYGTTAVITVTGEAANSYSWSTSQSGTNSITVSPSINTIYSVTASANGCTNTKSISIVVDPCDKVGLSQIESSNSLSLFPNPCTTNFSISNPHNNFTSLKIYDAMGKQVLIQKLIADENAIDVAALSKGMYFVEVVSGKGEVVRSKVIKE